MNKAMNIEHYLSGLAQAKSHPSGQETRNRSWPFVTISRQAGAGGHSLAQALLSAFAENDDALFQNWQILDRERLQEVMGDAHVSQTLKEVLDEHYQTQIGEFVTGLLGGRLSQDTEMLKVCEAIRSFASLGKVIVVGYAGVMATRELPMGVHIRLVAPEAWRVLHMEHNLGTDQKASQVYIRKYDQQRQRFLNAHFNANIDDPLLYDTVWNTEKVSFRSIAEATVLLLKHRDRYERFVQSRGAVI